MSDLQREKERAREVLEQKAIALDLPQLSVASEYYTEEEMVKFRKRKKRKRKEKFKVEDLVSLDNEGGGGDGRDHGSRQRDAISDEPMETDIKPGYLMCACTLYIIGFNDIVHNLKIFCRNQLKLLHSISTSIYIRKCNKNWG